MPESTHHSDASQGESKAQRRETDAVDASVDGMGPDEGEQDAPREIGGRDGPDPTRYGDWEKGGRCIDF